MPSADKGTEYPGDSKEGLPTQLVEEAECHLKTWRFQFVASLGSFTEIFSSIFGLGDPIDSVLSSKEGPVCLSFSCCALDGDLFFIVLW